MALKRNERYPGRFSNPTVDHPQGAFKNRSAPGAQDGSYLEQDWANDWDGFFSSLLSEAGITANGNVDAVGSSQYYTALTQLFRLASTVTPISAGGTGASTAEIARINLGLGNSSTLNTASNADMQTGTSTTLVTTVANVLSLFSKKVFSISDYIRIPDRPGGLILQWTQTGSIGSVAADNAITPRAVTFPIPFPNAALNYVAFPSAPNSTQAGVVPIASELTQTGCNVGLYNSTTTAKTVTNIIVFAVGY